jgi:hypothetical protein
MGGMGRKSDQDGIQIEPKIHWKDGIITEQSEPKWNGREAQASIPNIPPFQHSMIPFFK